MKHIIIIILAFVIVSYPRSATGGYLLLHTSTTASADRDDTLSKRGNTKNRQQILKQMENAMGKFPGLNGLPSFDIRITDSLEEHNYKRYTIKFIVAKNERLPAFLFIPLSKK